MRRTGVHFRDVALSIEVVGLHLCIWGGGLMKGSLWGRGRGVALS